VATSLETKLTELIDSLNTLKSLLETYNDQFLAEPSLTAFYKYSVYEISQCVFQLSDLVDTAKNVPLGIAMAAAQGDFSYIGYTESGLISSRLKELYARLPSSKKKKFDFLVKLSQDSRKVGADILYEYNSLKNESKEKAVLQFSEQIIVARGKKINLTITYGGKNGPGNPLWYITAGRSYDEIKQEIKTLNSKLRDAVQFVFESEFFERVFGPSFTKTVQVYVYKDSKGTAAACLREVAYWFKSTIRHAEYTIQHFVPTIEDMRFSLDTSHLMNATVQGLEATIVHEITHAFDEKLAYRKGDRRIYEKIREEGLARFQEVSYDPTLLSKFKNKYRVLWETAVRMPFNNLAALQQDDEKDVEFSYGLGLLMMLQLFIKLVGVSNVKVTGLSDLWEPSMINYRTQALNLLNTVRFMNGKTFFDYYKKKVDKPVFTESLFSEIQIFETGMAANRRPNEKMNLPK